MFNKIKIMFATDFSQGTKAALRLLPQLQIAYNAEVSLVHVVSSFWKDWVSSGFYSKEAFQRLKTWQQKIAPNEDSPEKLFVITGSPPESIVTQAKRSGVDIIMLGSRGEMSHNYFPDRVSEYVVKHAEQSVWLCKSDQVKRVICGIDASSIKPLQASLEICRRFHAKLCLVSVIPHFDLNPLGLEDEEVKEAEEKFRQQTIKEVEDFLNTVDLNGVDIEKLYPWGVPSRVILDLAEDFDYDLVVIGAKGQGLIQDALVGTTAERVLKRVRSSLFVVR